MSEKSLLWNALPDATKPTGFDRTYNGDDLSEWFSYVISTGVFKTDTALKVTATGGMSIGVAAGRAVINGKPYVNDSTKAFTVPTAPTGSSNRIDLVVVRFDRSIATRDTRLVYIKGADNNTMPAIKRDALCHDLVLAKITVTPNATAITQTNIADLRGDNTSNVTTESGVDVGFCPWTVVAKGYEDYYDAVIQRHEYTQTLSTASNVIITDIASSLYKDNYSIVEVETNGIAEISDVYSVTAPEGGYLTITFTANRIAGTKVRVVLDNLFDGEGLQTVGDQVTELAEEVANLANVNDYNYVCTGIDDNFALSEMIQAYLDGGSDSGSKKITIYGNFGCTRPVGGSGTTASPYHWLNVGQANSKSRRIILDFSSCGQITLPLTAGTYNIVFYGADAHIIGANVSATQQAQGTTIRMFNSTSGAVFAENCRFWINGYQDSMIAVNGTFNRCRGSVANVINNSYCFLPSASGILRINGGEYYAYCGGSSLQSAIVGQSSANSVSILYDVSAPTQARSGYYQTNSLLQWTGGGILCCTDLISALPMVVVAGISNIRGIITYSKAGQL